MESYHLRYTPSRRPVIKRRSYKRFMSVALMLLMLLSGGLYSFLAITKPVAALVPTHVALTPISETGPELPWPQVGQAALGSVEQGVLATSHPKETQAPTASIAKVITALAVLEKKPMTAGANGELITLDEQDVDFYNHYVAIGGSNAPVEAGEQLTQYEAFEALLLPSANNMADTLATWAFGSIENYIAQANQRVQDWGLAHTVVADASGFSSGTMSTPSDLILLGQKALKTPVLREIVQKTEATIPVAGVIHNSNQLLGQDNVVGIKTGHTDEAGGCLLFAASHNIDTGHSVTIIGAVMGAADISDAFSVSQDLLRAARPGFQKITVVPAGISVGNISLPWSDTVPITTSEALTAYGWKGTHYQPQISLATVSAPSSKGQKVGMVSIASDNQQASVNAVLGADVYAPSINWKLTHFSRPVN